MLNDGSDLFDNGNNTISILFIGSNSNYRNEVFSDGNVRMSLLPFRCQRILPIGNSTYNNNSHKNNNMLEAQSLINSHTFLPDVNNVNLKVRHRL